MNTILYAGDTNLLGCGENPERLSDMEGNELQKLKSWVHSNKLTLNPGKSKFIIFRNQPTNSNKKLKIKHIEIKQVYEIKFPMGRHIYIFERQTRIQLSSSYHSDIKNHS